MSNNNETSPFNAFENIRKDIPDLEIQKHPSSLPELMENEEDLKKTYQLAFELWQLAFDPEEIRQLIDQYLSLSKSSEDSTALQDIKKKLKKIRKAGLIFGTAKHFCHKESALPSDFIFFLKKMGKLADHFENINGPQKAKEVLEILDYVSQVDLQYEPNDLTEYKSRIKVFKDRAQSLLEKDELKIPTFHQLRKELRHIMNLYQIAAASDQNDKETLKAFHFLVQLNSQLGDIHDEYVEKQIKNQIDYDNSTMKIPENIKLLLENFYKLL